MLRDHSYVYVTVHYGSVTLTKYSEDFQPWFRDHWIQVYILQGQLDAKMLGALLTGVNRAFPFLKGTFNIDAMTS